MAISIDSFVLWPIFNMKYYWRRQTKTIELKLKKYVRDWMFYVLFVLCVVVTVFTEFAFMASNIEHSTSVLTQMKTQISARKIRIHWIVAKHCRPQYFTCVFVKRAPNWWIVFQHTQQQQQQQNAHANNINLPNELNIRWCVWATKCWWASKHETNAP